MKKLKRIISSLLIGVILFPMLFANVGSAEDVERPYIGTIDGEKVYGDQEYWDSYESAKGHILELVSWEMKDKESSGLTDEQIILKNEREFNKDIKRDTIYFMINEYRNHMVVANGYKSKEEMDKLSEEDQWKIHNEFTESFLEEAEKIVTDEYIEKKIQENPNYNKQYHYEYADSYGLEDAKTVAKAYSDEKYLEVLRADVENFGKAKRTLLDEFNRYGQYPEGYDEAQANMKHFTSGGGIAFGLGGLIESYIPEELRYSHTENVDEYLKDLKPGENTGPILLDKDTGIYRTILLIDIVDSDDRDLKSSLIYEEAERLKYESVKDSKIELNIPEYNIKELMKENIPVKVASVNGVDITIPKLELETLKYGDEADVKRDIDYTINELIMKELKIQDMKDRGIYKENLKTDEELWNMRGEYQEAILDEIDVTEKDIDEFIEENKDKIFIYKYGLFEFINTENKEEVYKELSKDDHAVVIARVFNEIRNGEEYELSPMEKKILSSYESDTLRIDYDDTLFSGDIFFSDKDNPYRDEREEYHYENLKDLEVGNLGEIIEMDEDNPNSYADSAYILIEVDRDSEDLRERVKWLLSDLKIKEYNDSLYQTADIKIIEK